MVQQCLMHFHMYFTFWWRYVTLTTKQSTLILCLLYICDLAKNWSGAIIPHDLVPFMRCVLLNKQIFKDASF